MSEAPERIYLDGDVEAGDGMFPRCFENAKYASDPPVEYIRSDLAAAKLATCEKYRDAYAECDRIGTQAVRDLEAKLKTVVEDKVDVVVKLTKLQTYLEDFFTLLDKTEETDEGRVFRPNKISSCRVQDGQMLDNLLRLMKASVEIKDET